MVSIEMYLNKVVNSSYHMSGPHVSKALIWSLFLELVTEMAKPMIYQSKGLSRIFFEAYSRP